MKIAFLHMTMGITSRGSEVVIDTIATELSKKHEVLVIQSGKVSPKKYQVKRVNPLDVSPAVAPSNILDKILFRLHLDKESGAVAEFTRSAVQVLTKYEPDIIVSVNGPLQLKILQGQTLQAKLVVFGHAGIGYHDRDNLAAHPDLFISLTQSAFAWATQKASTSTKVVYIPNPIKIAKSKSIDLQLPSPVILTVSALSQYKNVDKVASAIKMLPYPWLLIGDGEGRGVIESQLSSLANDFRWLRAVDQSEMGSYYQSADAFCFTPAVQESFGMVYLEAMSHGLPIVASDDPIRRELIGEKGIYVDPGDQDQIVSGIQKAVSMGRQDYSKEIEPYSLKIVVSKIEKEFHDLIS